MNDVVADAVRVFLRPDGIVVEFGRASTAAGTDEVTIAPLDRVLMPPATFRRFGLALHDAVRALGPGPVAVATPSPPSPKPPPPQGAGTPARSSSDASRSLSHATSTGSPPSPAPVPSADASPPARPRPALETLLDPTRDMPSSRAALDETGEAATWLFRLIANLGLPFVHERSFRMRQEELLPNRYLLSVSRRSDGGRCGELFAGAFRRLDMPGDFLAAAERNLPRARCVHFGFEADDDGHLLKVYLEIGPEAGEVDGIGAARSSASEAVLEHIAYKWNPANPEHRVVGQYLHYPALSVAAIRRRLEAVYSPSGTGESLEIAAGVLELAAERMPQEDIRYLEVEEEGNDRRSFSVNFYDAGLLVRDLYPLLSRMRRRYGVSPTRFQVLYDQIKDRRFGHLAGGLHRNGRDFFTVYYGPQFYGEGHWRGATTRNRTITPTDARAGGDDTTGGSASTPSGARAATDDATRNRESPEADRPRGPV